MIVCLSILLSACAVRPGSEDLSPSELKTAGDATLLTQRNVDQVYDHAAFIEPSKKETSHANS